MSALNASRLDMLNPELDREQAVALSVKRAEAEQHGPAALRKRLDGAGRIAQAEAWKADANVKFSDKAYNASLAGYVAGIWMLAKGDPQAPWIVIYPRTAQEEVPPFAEVPAALGAGSGDEEKLPSELEEKRDTLRVTLHLNLAAAALQIKEWSIARTACEFVLATQGDAASLMARYWLAVALDGQGDIDEAHDVLIDLIELDEENAAARKLLEKIVAAIHFRLAIKLKGQGKVDEAHSVLTRLLAEFDPDHEDAKWLLKEVEAIQQKSALLKGVREREKEATRAGQ